MIRKVAANILNKQSNIQKGVVLQPGVERGWEDNSSTT